MGWVHHRWCPDKLYHRPLICPGFWKYGDAGTGGVKCGEYGKQKIISEEKINEFAERFKMPRQIFAGEQPAQEIITQIKNLK